MIGHFHWVCPHVLGSGGTCNWVNSVDLDTRFPEPKALVCAFCQTPAGAEVLLRNSGA